jgi:hypothetical protein
MSVLCTLLRLSIVLLLQLACVGVAFGQTSDSTSTVTITIVGPSTFTLTSQNQIVPSAFSVRVTDPHGNPIPGITVSFFVNAYGCFSDGYQCTLPPPGFYGTFAEGVLYPVTDNDGLASVGGFVGGSQPGSYDIAAQIQYSASAANQQLIGQTHDVDVLFHINQNFLGFSVTPGVSGSWFDPSTSGQGFNFEVLSPTQMLVYFYTFDALGNNIFLTGVGSINGTDVSVPLTATSGGVAPPNFDSSKVVRTDWGTLDVQFLNCNFGVVSWNVFPPFAPASGNGNLSITRITSIQGLPCP